MDDVSGRLLYIYYVNGTIINKSLYFKGYLVGGIWDKLNNQIVVYKNEKEELILQLENDRELTAKDVKAWIGVGLIRPKISDKRHLTSVPSGLTSLTFFYVGV